MRAVAVKDVKPIMGKKIMVGVELPAYLSADGELLYLLSCLTDDEASALNSYAKFFIKGMLFNSGRYAPEQLAEIEAAAEKAK